MFASGGTSYQPVRFTPGNDHFTIRPRAASRLLSGVRTTTCMQTLAWSHRGFPRAFSDVTKVDESQDDVRAHAGGRARGPCALRHGRVNASRLPRGCRHSSRPRCGGCAYMSDGTPVFATQRHARYAHA